MGKFKKRQHWQRNNEPGLGGVREGMVPLMRTVIPGVGFLNGKAVLYNRVPGDGLKIYPRTIGNLIRIFLRINAFLARKNIAKLAWAMREARDNLIIVFRNLKARFNADHKK